MVSPKSTASIESEGEGNDPTKLVKGGEVTSSRESRTAETSDHRPLDSEQPRWLQCRVSGAPPATQLLVRSSMGCTDRDHKVRHKAETCDISSVLLH